MTQSAITLLPTEYFTFRMKEAILLKEIFDRSSAPIIELSGACALISSRYCNSKIAVNGNGWIESTHFHIACLEIFLHLINLLTCRCVLSICKIVKNLEKGKRHGQESCCLRVIAIAIKIHC